MHALSRFCLGLLLMSTMGCGSRYFEIFSPDPVLPAPVIVEVNNPAITALIQDYTVRLQHDEEVFLDQAKVFINEGIDIVHLEFHTQRILDMCEARDLIIDMCETLLTRLNEDPVLKDQFSSYPFSPNNLEIYVNCTSYFGQYNDVFYTHWICVEDGLITYYTWDLEDGSKNIWHSRKESYETSREISVYQRQAEEEYVKEHEPDTSVFGNQRYYPPKEPVKKFRVW